MCPPDDKYTVVYVVPPSTDTDETVDALQDDEEITVETVRSTTAGRERLDAGDVDCVVSAYQLPDGDGLAFLETVREDHAQLPFVLYTAAGSETVAVEAFRRGVTDYVRRSAADARSALRDCVRNALAVTDDYRDRTSELPQVRRVAHSRTELEALTTRYRLALDGTDTGIWEWDLDTDELVWDRRAERLAGYDPGEFAGTVDAFTDRVHPDDREVIETAREQAIETGSYEAEYRIVVDGRERWLHTRAEVFYHDDGTPDRMLGVGWDITDRKRRQQELAETRRDLEETKEYYRRLFAQSSDYVVVVGEAGTVQDVTQGVTRVLGYEPDEIIGTDAMSYIHPADKEQIRGVLEDVIEQPDTEMNVEYRVRTADGSYRWLEARGTNHLDDPLLGGLVANIRDISERKEREQELEALTTRLELALEETDTGVWDWDLKTDEVEWDEASERLFGYEVGRFPGTWEGFARRVPDDDLTAVKQAATEAIENDQQYQADYRIELPNGERRWIQGRGVVEYDADGEPDQMLGIHTEITDRKEAEQAVEETKEYYRRLFEQSSDFVLVVDEDGTINDVTQGIEHVVGHEPEALVGTDAFTYVHPDDRDRLADAMRKNIRNPDDTVVVEYRSQAKDGSYRWLEAKGRNHLDDPLLDGLVANVRDISERKEREQELEALTTRLELTLEETDTGVWEWDLDTDEIIWDEACEQLFGYEPGEFPGTYEEVARRLSEDDLAAFERTATEAIADDCRLQLDFSIELPDGEERWIQSRGVVEYDADGEAERMRGIKTDITDQKEAEQAVEETKQYYQRLFQQASDYVTVVDEAGTISDITPGVKQVLGYEPTEAIGMDAFSLIHPDDCERVRGVLADVVKNSDMEISMEYRARAKNGDYRWMEARGGNYLDDQLLDGIVVYVRDITQQKERQQELATKTARLQLKNEQLERLAQIVSHDLQTPLSTAEKLTGLLRSDLADPDPAVEQSLRDLEATHQRLRAFADHLPRLARESTDIEESTACDIGSIAEAAWEVVDTGPLELRVESTWRLDGDPERLQRAFENLVQNTVVHGVRAVDDEQIAATTVRVGAVDDGFYIADDGPGIRPEQRAELFEYGMGTGSGSGFGLAIVRTIIEAHGWTITVTESRSGGARFEVDTT